MKTICAYTSPASGHLFPLMPILLELAGRGHRVVVRTLADRVDQIAATGIGAEPLDPAVEARSNDDWKGGSDLERLKLAMEAFADRGRTDGTDLGEMITRHQPDLLLVDVHAWGAQAKAEASGIPWASYGPYFTPVPDPAVPPFGPGFKPISGPLGRIRNRVIGAAMAAKLNRDFLGLLNEVRDLHGGRELDSIFATWTHPPLLLYLVAEQLEYRRDSWPENFFFTGALNWEPESETPDWVEGLEGPVTLVTGSTEFQDDHELIAVALEALSGGPGTVVATAAANDPARFEIPANARVERFVPHSALLPKADLVVAHGGMGVTNKALAAGVPVCVVGWGRDQLEVGRRVEQAGVGSFVRRGDLDVETLRAAASRARSCSARASRLAAEMDTAPGASGAADELERLAGDRAAELSRA